MQVFICIQNGYSKAEAEALDEVERLAVYYAVVKQNGWEVDWATGEVKEK
jgi:hypothetical protein